MSINETPKVKYYESDSNPILSGTGAEIPCFIGITGNTTPKTGIQKFKNFQQVYKTVENGGIGTDLENNQLLITVNDFFKEIKKFNSDDITVPYIYIIDLGAAEVSTPKPWLDAMNEAKKKREIQVEAYVGFKKEDTAKSIISIMNSAVELIKQDSEHGNPRIAYFTVIGANDEESKTYTDDSQEIYIQNTRAVLMPAEDFGKNVAKVCITPYYEEPGFTDFRTITPGKYSNRTREECNELQAAGITFINDELAASEIHPRINLAVSTAFATTPDNRPNDSLIHARRNVDQLIREVYDALYVQLKRNETETNLSYLQSDIDVIVDRKISDGYMMNGTEIKVVESEINPYDLKCEGVAVPVNSTLLIGFSMYIESPNATVGGN